MAAEVSTIPRLFFLLSRNCYCFCFFFALFFFFCLCLCLLRLYLLPLLLLLLRCAFVSLLLLLPPPSPKPPGIFFSSSMFFPFRCLTRFTGFRRIFFFFFLKFFLAGSRGAFYRVYGFREGPLGLRFWRYFWKFFVVLGNGGTRVFDRPYSDLAWFWGSGPPGKQEHREQNASGILLFFWL